MEDITEAYYAHTKRVCKDYEIKKITRILWFVCCKQYISNTLADLRTSKICLEIYQLDTAKFLSAPELQ